MPDGGCPSECKLRIGARRRRCPASYGAHRADLVAFRSARWCDAGVAEVETPLRQPAPLTAEQRRQALARWQVLRPHLEDGVPLVRLAAQRGLPERTFRWWRAHYRILPAPGGDTWAAAHVYDGSGSRVVHAGSGEFGVAER